jgi:dynein heavy chain
MVLNWCITVCGLFNLKTRAKRARIESFIVNPKSINISELYGNTDPTTFEWTDGIFSNSVRTFVNNATGADADVYIFFFYINFHNISV